MNRQCSVDQYINGKIHFNCSNGNLLNSECDVVCHENKDLYYKNKLTKIRIKCLLGNYRFEWKIISYPNQTYLLSRHNRYITCKSRFMLTAVRSKFQTTLTTIFANSTSII